MAFYPFLGWSVFWISFITAIIIFIKHKKLYPVMYLISIALYVFTSGFVIDVFELEKLGILTVLVSSAIIFMGLGHYFSKVLHLNK
jgi:uncharacterized membrane protein YvlD (DUF360 family)